MKVIFLDIDGVLNCSTTKIGVNASSQIWNIDNTLVPNLNKIIDAFDPDDITVVLSSSWRYAHRKRQIDINILLKEAGYTGPEIVEMTPETSEDIRGKEIRSWLDHAKDVESFVILDDDTADMLEFMDFIVEPSFEGGGLSSEHANIAVYILRDF